MKSDREIMRSIRAAIDDCTRGIDEAPSLQYRIARKAKGEEPMAKKISTAMILVIVLIIVSMTAALAAGLGLFGQLAQDDKNVDSRLAGLEEAADTVSASLTTEDGITVEIGQAYYEGNRVFMAYRLSGNLFSAELYEGAPEGDYPWDLVLENCIGAEHWVNDVPELQRLNAWMDGKGQHWGTAHEAALHDGLSLADGTYLDIIGGDNVIQADGSVIGWKECEIPEDRIADTLTFKAVLFRGNYVKFQDENTFKMRYERGESTDIFFTVKHNDHAVFLKGTASSEMYQSQVEFASGQIDTRGTVRLTCPAEWVNIEETWENEQHLDYIADWKLYQNGTPVEGYGTEGIRVMDQQTLVFTLMFNRVDKLENLTLVPVYSQTGEHPNEAIPIERIAE
ncbi:MAG: DUF4179 domain-containing protein [Clostridia bacterium]|nr:DUF4179 domain-containing protein [Clostridia bacterium]